MTFDQALSSVREARVFISSEMARAQTLIHDTKTLCHFVFKSDFQAQKYVSAVFQNRDEARAKYYEAFLQKTVDQHQEGVFMLIDAQGVRHILGVAPEAENPLALLYAGVRVIIGILQAAQLYPEYFENLEKRFWELREKGFSAVRIEQTFKNTIFNYEKVKNITNAYKMLQAHSAAAVYMFISAAGNAPMQAKMKDFALRQTALLSADFPEVGAGALAYAATVRLFSQIENGGAGVYLSVQNLPDWGKVFDYTLAAAKNAGYSAHQIMDAPFQEGAFLKALEKEYPKAKERLNILQWSNEYKSSKMLQDYAAVQAFLLSN